MGESRGGGGSNRQVTTSDLARRLVRLYTADGRRIKHIHVQHVTGPVYAVEVTILGENTPEAFFQIEEGGS